MDTLETTLDQLLAELHAARALLALTHHGPDHRAAVEAVSLARDVISDARDSIRAHRTAELVEAAENLELLDPRETRYLANQAPR